MNILWVTNVPLPCIAQKIGIGNQPLGGWLTGYANSLKKKKEINLTCMFPNNKKVEGKLDGFRYVSFDPTSKDVLAVLVEIIKHYSPDVVHIFGTEFQNSYLVARACQHLGISEKIIVSIQGLVSVYAQHYYAYLPNTVVQNWSIRDLLRWDNIAKAKKKFEKRGYYEKKTLLAIQNVIGRTDWDKACVLQINPKLNYYFCNESLRNSFYEHQWTFDECEKHSIFVSQSSYPIKGFHLMLEAFALIKKKYPDAILYTTGNNIEEQNLSMKFREGSYTKYLRKLIRTYQLEESVKFIGLLNEQEMCKRYLKSNVFVSCSSIENSPNSVGEAMLLGVPTISSDVGGVRNMLTDCVDGYIYPADEPYMIAYYVDCLFSNQKIMEEFSNNSRLHALKTHDREKNAEKLLKIYKVIGEK